MNSVVVVVHEERGNGVLLVFNSLAVGDRKPSHPYSHREVRHSAFDAELWQAVANSETHTPSQPT